jgi:hypothetical protein
VPSFDTPSSALFFIRDYVEEGHFKPCVHLKAGVVDSGQLTAPGGYGPVCQQESFRIDRDDRGGATTFYGCPAECSLFQEDPRKAPWRAARPEPAQPRVAAWPARRAWVAAAAMALVTLSGTAMWWMSARTGSQVVASDQSWWAGSNKPNRPGQASSDGQFGRELFIQPGSVFALIRPIAQVVIEAHFTTTPKAGAKVPPAEVTPLRSRDAHAALAGPPGQVRLDLAKLTRYRQQNDGSVVISNRFVLPQASDLHQRPVEVLGDYRTLDVPLTAPEFEDGFSTVQRVDVLMTVNGQGVWHSLWLAPPEAAINWQRVQFPLDGLKARLAQGREE